MQKVKGERRGMRDRLCYEESWFFWFCYDNFVSKPILMWIIMVDPVKLLRSWRNRICNLLVCVHAAWPDSAQLDSVQKVRNQHTKNAKSLGHVKKAKLYNQLRKMCFLFTCTLCTMKTVGTKLSNLPLPQWLLICDRNNIRPNNFKNCTA